MTTATHSLVSPYKQSTFVELDPLLRRCLSISAAIGVVFLIAVFLTPRRSLEITKVEEVPERFAKLILENKPAPPPVVIAKSAPKEKPAPGPKADGGGGGGGGGGSPAPGPDKIVARPTRPGARPASSLAPAARPSGGGAGRARAEAEVSQQLADVTGSLSGLISEVTTTLSKGAGIDDIPASRRPRRGAVRSGRSGAEVGTVPSGPGIGTGDLALADSGPLRGTVLDIGLITRVGGTGNGLGTGDGGPGSGTGSGGGHGSGHGSGTGSGTGPGSGSGSGGGHGGGRGTGTGDGSGPGAGETGGDIRSDASLLAVVRKYAAGIRFCYDTELKRDPALRGKLVVAITVAASGAVLEARPVQDTLGSSALTSCALAQIKSWKFSQVPDGVVTFQAPFVFTPPE